MGPEFDDKIPRSNPRFGSTSTDDRLERLEKKQAEITNWRAQIERRQRWIISGEEGEETTDLDKKARAVGKMIDALAQKQANRIGFGKWLWGALGALGLLVAGAAINTISTLITGHRP